MNVIDIVALTDFRHADPQPFPVMVPDCDCCRGAVFTALRARRSLDNELPGDGHAADVEAARMEGYRWS